jgi:hypothetical protein
MKIQGKAFADAMLSFSPIILMVSLCVYLLTTPVSENSGSANGEQAQPVKVVKKDPGAQRGSGLAEPLFIINPFY